MEQNRQKNKYNQNISLWKEEFIQMFLIMWNVDYD